MGYAFISYKREEEEKAKALRKLFMKNGIECWMDTVDIPAGSNWDMEINDAIESDNCSCFVLLLTESTQTSNFILDEIATARDANKDIIPIRLENFTLNSAMRFYLRRRHMEDVESIDENDSGMKKVIDAVIQHTGVNEEFAKKAKELEIVTVIDKDGYKYVGQMKDGKYHGKGTLYNPDGSKWYEGDWVSGKKHGKGTGYSPDGSKLYEGDWVDGKPNGKGTSYYDNGLKYYEGDFVDGKMHGKGIEYNDDGAKYYEGDFVDAKMHGIGTSYYPDGSKQYEGDWVDNDWHGKGTSYYDNGSKRYEGDWVHGIYHGRGTWYRPDGSINFSGEFENDFPKIK